MPAASYVLDGRAVYWPSAGGCSSKLAMSLAGSGRENMCQGNTAGEQP